MLQEFAQSSLIARLWAVSWATPCRPTRTRLHIGRKTCEVETWRNPGLGSTVTEAPSPTCNSGWVSVSSPRGIKVGTGQLCLGPAAMFVLKASTTGDSLGQPLRGGSGMFPVCGEHDALVHLQNLQLPFNSYSA